MMLPLMSQICRAAGVCILLGTIVGCSGSGAVHRPAEQGDRPLRAEAAGDGGSQSVGGRAGGSGRAEPVLIVDGVGLTRDDLWSLLAEAGGRQAVEELVLDRRLEDELRRRGVTLESGAVARERRLLGEALAEEARLSGERAETMIDGLRRTRGLGPERFERLLRRNAMLRALVADQVEVTQEAVRLAHAVEHGPKIAARVIVTAEMAEASAVRSRLSSGGRVSVERFSAEAARVSIDPSADRGGLIDPISPDDPAYTRSIRAALEQTADGELSRVVPFEQGYALFLREGVVAGDRVPLSSVSATIAEQVRRRGERVEMEKLARSLLERSGIGVADPALRWSWESRRRTGG